MRTLLLGSGVLLFSYFASLQLNDPDPVGWTLLYGAAAGLCLGGVMRAPMAVPAGLLAALALGRAGWLYTDAQPDILRDGFDDEVVRELGGLVVVGIVALAILGTGRGVAGRNGR